MQGFYLLAVQRQKRQKRIVILVCLIALLSLLLAIRVACARPAVTTDAPAEPYIASSEQGMLVVSRGGESVIHTEIDVRSLPVADREKLEAGITLPNAEALAHLLEDFSS